MALDERDYHSYNRNKYPKFQIEYEEEKRIQEVKKNIIFARKLLILGIIFAATPWVIGKPVLNYLKQKNSPIAIEEQATFTHQKKLNQMQAHQKAINQAPDKSTVKFVKTTDSTKNN